MFGCLRCLSFTCGFSIKKCRLCVSNHLNARRNFNVFVPHTPPHQVCVCVCVLDNQFWQDQTLKTPHRSAAALMFERCTFPRTQTVNLNSRGKRGTNSWCHECKAEYLQDVQLLSRPISRRSTENNPFSILFLGPQTNTLRDTWRRTRSWVISSVNSYRKFRYTVDTILRLYFLTDIHSTIYFILHSTAILFYKSEKDYIKKML